MSDLPPKKKFRKWYRNRDDAIGDGWPVDIDGVELTLDNYNHMADIAKVMFDANPDRDSDEVKSSVIASFKKQNVVRGGEWVLRSIYTLASGVQFQNPYAPQPKIESKNFSAVLG